MISLNRKCTEPKNKQVSRFKEEKKYKKLIMKFHEFLENYSPDELSKLSKNDRAAYMRYSRLLKNIDIIKRNGAVSQSFMNSVDGNFNDRAAQKYQIKSSRSSQKCSIESCSDSINENINDDTNTGNY